jgi:uncharacterized membrane protein
MGTLRKYIIAGLLVWLPLAATIVIISFVIDILDGTILLLPPEYRPEAVLGFSIPGFGVVFAIAVLLLTGMLAANLLGRRLVSFWEAILSRIPLVRTIYNSTKQIATTVLTSEGKSFRKVVLVEYPRKDTWSMGFLTNEHIVVESNKVGRQISAVFVPTTPNPTSGFIIMIPKEDIIELDITIEDGFKYIISMGVITPDHSIKEVLQTNKVANQSPGS